MMANMVKSVVCKVVLVLINLCMVLPASIQTMEQSCVLSLVVPRDKIKTSCSVDDKVKRRINTLETKINIYKQQVLELETRIHKERLLNNDKIMSLEAMLSKMDKLEDLDKRISNLESLEERNDNGYNHNNKEYKFTNNMDGMTSDQSLTNKQYGKFSKTQARSNEKNKLLQELENMKSTINETGNNIVHRVEDVLKNVTEKIAMNKTFTNNLDDVIESERGSAIGELLPGEPLNHIPVQNDQPSKRVQTPMSNDTDENRENDTNYNNENVETNRIPLGHSPLIKQLEEILKKEINNVLNHQMEEVISLVEKQQSSNDGFDDQVSLISDQHLSDIKYLNDKIAALELNTMSISQTMDDFYSKTEKLQKLPTLLEELKKNLTSNTGTKANRNDKSLIEKIDEHDKKLRTMDRLTVIFRRSLAHYRNESKAAYAELESKVSSESTMVKTLRETIIKNVSTLVEGHVNLQNQTVKRKLKDMKSLLTSLEDHNVLMQVDWDTAERKLKSKMSKLEHDVRIAKDDIQNLGLSQGLVQKKQKTLVDDVSVLQTNTDVNDRIDTLELDFKLSLTSDWVQYPFAYETTRTFCFGDQYIKKTNYKHGRYVGVVLCNADRYKIFLGQNLKDKFLNIGDEVGLGQDHCEYVGGNSNAIVKVSNPSMSFTQDKGYTRAHWGDETRLVVLDFLRPSPSWYECGVQIP